VAVSSGISCFIIASAYLAQNFHLNMSNCLDPGLSRKTLQTGSLVEIVYKALSYGGKYF